VRKLACAFPEPEQLRTNKGSSKLPHSKETVDYSFVSAGLLSVHPCSSVVFVHTFGCGSAAPWNSWQVFLFTRPK